MENQPSMNPESRLEEIRNDMRLIVTEAKVLVSHHKSVEVLQKENELVSTDEPLKKRNIEDELMHYREEMNRAYGKMMYRLNKQEEIFREISAVKSKESNELAHKTTNPSPNYDEATADPQIYPNFHQVLNKYGLTHADYELIKKARKVAQHLREGSLNYLGILEEAK